VLLDDDDDDEDDDDDDLCIDGTLIWTGPLFRTAR
jgi:hypothetical protein